MKKYSCDDCANCRNFIQKGQQIDRDCVNFAITDEDFEIYMLNGRVWYGANNGCHGFRGCTNEDRPNNQILCQ